MKALFRRFFRSSPDVPVVEPKEPFLEMAGAYQRRLDAKVVQCPKAGSESIAVLVTPWLWTAVPLVALEIAQLFAQSGRRVTLLWDENDLVGNAAQPTHLEALRKLGEAVGSEMTVERIPRSQPETTDSSAEVLAKSNAVWRMRGEGETRTFEDNQPQAAAKIAGHTRVVTEVLEKIRPQKLVIPGGIYGLSGAYVSAARRLGIGFQTFDSGPGLLRLCQNGVAAHLGDLPTAHRELVGLMQADDELAQRIIRLAEAELDDRINCRDFRHFQTVASSGNQEHRYTLLVPLNISWDSAALGQESAFDSITHWLTSLIKWLTTHPNVSLCLRQHPRERLDFARSVDDFSKLIEPFPSLKDRIRYVRADEPISTYDLLQQTELVLPHTSTFGIEAAFAGKPVLIATNCYYAKFNFIRRARTADEYFQTIEAILKEKPRLTPDQKFHAAAAYFLTQKCAFIQTDFTPQPDGFERWVNIPFDELWQRQELQDLRESLLSGAPLSLVRARRLLEINRSNLVS